MSITFDQLPINFLYLTNFLGTGNNQRFQMMDQSKSLSSKSKGVLIKNLNIYEPF